MSCFMLGVTLLLNAHCAPQLDLGEQMVILAQNSGYRLNMDVKNAILEASVAYNLNPFKMLKIAMIESSLNPKAKHKNLNGTWDIGLFQINSINNNLCKEYNIHTLKGNALCGAKLLDRIKKRYAMQDTHWIARYNSNTLDKRKIYWNRYAKL